MNSFGQHMRSEIVAAKRGLRPTPPEDTDWSLRRAPPNRVFNRRRNQILQRGLLCRLQLWVGGSNEYPDNPLLGLQVTPLEQQITNAPATHIGVWHISVAFKDPKNRKLEKAFIKKYETPIILRLFFREINWNAHSELDPWNDPIATDPVVTALHQASHYKDRALHITF